MDRVPGPTKAETALLVELLLKAGLVEVYVNDEGQEACRLTEEGVRVGNMLAMVEGEEAEMVMEAVLADD